MAILDIVQYRVTLEYQDTALSPGFLGIVVPACLVTQAREFRDILGMVGLGTAVIRA